MLRLAVAALVLAVVPVQAARAAGALEMMTTSACFCCHAWAKHLREAGYSVAVKSLAMGQLMRQKLGAGVPAALTACHTGRIDGYVIEGHVPVREIRRLLAERPEAIGLAVPGMPIGSPGMEAGSKRAAYEVLLIKRDGTTEVFATYAGN